MKEECFKKLEDKYRLALRGFGKTRMVAEMLFYDLYRCMETEEEREWFLNILKKVGEEDDTCNRIP